MSHEYTQINLRLDGFGTRIGQMEKQVNISTQIQDQMSADVTMIKEALVGDLDGTEGLITRVSRVERFKSAQTWVLGIIFAGMLTAVGSALADKFFFNDSIRRSFVEQPSAEGEQ